MAVSGANLTAGGTATDLASYATASITPTANALVLAAMLSNHANPPTTATCSGCGITWTLVDSVTFSSLAAPTFRGHLFRGTSASPTTGALTFDFGGASQLNCNWSINEFTGVNLSAGSQGIVQNAQDRRNSGVQPNTLSLAAFADANNATYQVLFIQGTADTPTRESPYILLSGGSIVSMQLVNSYLATADTTPTYSLSGTSSSFGHIGVEIAQAAAVTGGGAAYYYRKNMGGS